MATKNSLCIVTLCIKNNMGGIKMIKITQAAIVKIKNEVQDLINEGKKPLIRLSMGIG